MKKIGEKKGPIIVLSIFVCAAIIIVLINQGILPIWFTHQSVYYVDKEQVPATPSPSPLRLPGSEIPGTSNLPMPAPAPTYMPPIANATAPASTYMPVPTQIPVQTSKSGLSPNEGPLIDFSILPDGRLDINLANRKQLMSLPGIGEKVSLRIIEYRDKNGPFLAFEDLLLVDGIKREVYEKLKEYAGVSF